MTAFPMPAQDNVGEPRLLEDATPSSAVLRLPKY